MAVNGLFGAVSRTKNVDIDKYRYSGYGIGFDRDNVYSVGNGFGRNVIIFGVDITAQKMKFSIKDFFNICDQIRSLLKKCLMENFIFLCSV